MLPDNDPRHLHDLVREMSAEVNRRLEAAGIPLADYEGFRTPQRQAVLYARGRIPGHGELGKTATRAKAWRSFHQYGLAVDKVFRVDGKWTWNEPERGMWDQYHLIARAVGLRPLSFERPHIELPGLDLRDLVAGRFPPDGGLAWEVAMYDSIMAWGQADHAVLTIVHPGAPPWSGRVMCDMTRPVSEAAG